MPTYQKSHIKKVSLFLLVLLFLNNCSPNYSYTPKSSLKDSHSTQTTIRSSSTKKTSLKNTSTPKQTINKPVYPLELQESNDCDPNYSGCVPIASDVDCAGGKGNGPAYVRGPVKVIGSDIYGLDRDKDGFGCE
jgi:hypothetical protein